MQPEDLTTEAIYKDKTYPAENRFMQYNQIQEVRKGPGVSCLCAIFDVYFQDKKQKDFVNEVAIDLNDLDRIERVY